MRITLQWGVRDSVIDARQEGIHQCPSIPQWHVAAMSIGARDECIAKGISCHEIINRSIRHLASL